jgi:hypothetical protein
LLAPLSCGAAALAAGESGGVIRRSVALIKSVGEGNLRAGALNHAKSNACKARESISQRKTRCRSFMKLDL